MNLYGILKVVHVLSVVAWLGGGLLIAVITARLLRARDHTALAALGPQLARFGPTIGGPASGLVLLSGIGMVLAGGLGFRALWVSLGFAGMAVHFLMGPLVMNRRSIALAQAVAAADDARIAQAGAKLRAASALYLLLMAGVVVVMVLKPVG